MRIYKFIDRKFILSFLIICLGQAKITLAQIPEIYAGVAQVDITPPVRYSNYRGISTGVHDPLFAKALVLREGDQQIALVVCDLLWITRELSSEVCLQVSEKTSIPYSNIIVAATQTHTSPAYHADIKELNEHLRPPPGSGLSNEDEEDYQSFLIQRIVQALIDASNDATRVHIETGTGVAEEISFNRRFIMKDGTVRTNAGVRNPDIIKPAGPIDAEVGIIFLRKATDNLPLASLTGFANHTDTFGGTDYSADYPGFLAKELSAVLGDDFISIFGLGACGNLNHVNVNSKSNRISSKQIGEKLAAVIKSEMPNLGRIKLPFLAARSEFVYVPLQQYTEAELVWAHNEEAEPLYKEHPFLARRRSLKIRSLEKMQKTGEAIPPTIGTEPWRIPLEVQVFQIGEDAVIVGFPGELFVELGMAIKEASPFKTTLVIELTNSHIAYVPTRDAFHQGSYETVNSRIVPGGGEMMVETAVRILKELSSSQRE